MPTTLELMTCDDLRLLIDYHYWARPGARRRSGAHARAIHETAGLELQLGARYHRAHLRC